MAFVCFGRARCSWGNGFHLRLLCCRHAKGESVEVFSLSAVLSCRAFNSFGIFDFFYEDRVVQFHGQHDPSDLWDLAFAIKHKDGVSVDQRSLGEECRCRDHPRVGRVHVS